MNNISVLHIIVTDAVAGAEKYLRHLLPALQDKGVNCKLLLICPPGFSESFASYISDLNANGIQTFIITTKRTFSLATISKVNAIIKKNHFNYIHSHLLRTDFLMAIIKKVFLPKLYLINTIHGYRETVSTHYDPSIPVKKGGVFNLLNKNILKQFNKTISISNTISQLYLDLGLTKNRFPVIHHGLDIDIEKLSKDDCTIENGTPFITVVGRLAEIKGQFYLIQAMPRILEHFPTCKLYILGQGPSESILKNAVNKLSLNNFVKFEGFQQNPYKYIKNAEVLVIPSIYEPFGLVYLEGMALKTPIVTFNIPIARELLQNEHTALFANKADPNDLAEKIIDLLNYPEKRKAMSNYAFEEYERKYRLENMVTKTFLFYQSIDK